MNENMKSGGYEVRKVKSFRGMEGFGFNAELLREGKPVALVIDEGNGGCYMFEWYDRSAAFVPVKGFNVIGEAFEFNGSPEEAKLQDYLNGLPWTENEWDKKKYPVSNNGFVGSLVDDFENAKKFKRMCKDKTLFRVKGDKPGEYRVVKFVYGQEMKEWLAKKYGDQVEEVLNEKFAA